MSKIIDMTNFCPLYNEFLTKYSNSSDHSIGSSLVYKLIKSNQLWLLSLLVGVAGYSVRFEEETSSVLSKELLDASGVIDPVTKYKSSIKPWTGRIAGGKNPGDPVTNRSLGIGIAHFQAGALSGFYKGTNLSCSIPLFDKDKNPIMNDNGKVKTEQAFIKIKGEPVHGWGLDYDNRRLNIQYLFKDCTRVYTKNEDDMCVCCGDINGKNIKWVGYNSNELDKPWIDRNWQESNIIPWCKYHLNDEKGRFYPPLKWFCGYWTECLIMSINSGHDDITHTMLLTGIANSGGSGTARKYANYDTDTIVAKYTPQLSENKQIVKLSHNEKRMLTFLRAIQLVKYLKQKKFN